MDRRANSVFDTSLWASRLERKVSMSEFTTETQKFITENLLKTASDLDRVMLEAVEAGIETGRSMGVIEAYNVLINEGHLLAAECLIGLIEEEAEIRRAKADA